MPDQALSVRKRQTTRNRISDCAATLVIQAGLTRTTVEQIAASADVGRATFFRYFSSKEDAVAEGMARHWCDIVTAAIARQPAELSATDAVVAAFADLGEGFGEIEAQVREMATMTRSSAALSAWTLQFYLGYEAAIADLVAPRLHDLTTDDPRPRLIGALAMAAIRVSLDDWLHNGGSLPERVQAAISSIRVS